MNNRQSSYEIVKLTDSAVFIVDLDGPLSVTNDAENVVDRLLHRYGNRRIIYKDTSGRWDELLHNGSEFTCFGPVSAQDLA
jgi:hypothetical protein